TAYWGGSYLAINSQVRDFTENKLFPALKANNIHEAFLYTLPPPQRRGIDPENAKHRQEMDVRFGAVGAPLYNFRESQLAHILERAEGNVEFQVLGTRSWSYEQDNFRVVQNAIMRTPEGRFAMSVALVGTEGKDIAGRQWHVATATDPLLQGTL